MKEKTKKTLWRTFKIIISIEYALGFIPCLLVSSFTNLFKKPENNKQFYKKLLYIQAFVFPIIIGMLIAFLIISFKSFIVEIFAVIISSLYILGIRFAQYENDPYLKIVAGENAKEINILKKRLITIKSIVFYLTLFAIGVFIRII
jgi:hypothetical protein